MQPQQFSEVSWIPSSRFQVRDQEQNQPEFRAFGGSAAEISSHAVYVVERLRSVENWWSRVKRVDVCSGFSTAVFGFFFESKHLFLVLYQTLNAVISDCEARPPATPLFYLLFFSYAIPFTLASPFS
jgi:hypothetical protein